MEKTIPAATLTAFARSIHREAIKYGFSRLDTVRLINELMDLAAETGDVPGSAEESPDYGTLHVASFPLRSGRLRIREVAPADRRLLESWLEDSSGRHFLLSCAAAEQQSIDRLLAGSRNVIGIVELPDGRPIGAVAYLDIDTGQKRAELRKLIGDPAERGKGFAEEATALWIRYGVTRLGLEKVYVSTLQTHLSNIRLNETVGFRVEGILRSEVLLEGNRHDVLRMGYCAVSAARR